MNGPGRGIARATTTCETKSVRKLSQCVLLVWMLTLLFQISTSRICAQSGPTSHSAEKERDLLQAVQRDPNNLQVVGSLGEYYFHREQWPQCVRWLTRAYQLS